MAENGDGFKAFVRDEIKNIRDAAERNYEEHKHLYGALADIRTHLAVLETRITGKTEVRVARVMTWGAVLAALVTGVLALIRSYA